MILNLDFDEYYPPEKASMYLIWYEITIFYNCKNNNLKISIADICL